MRHFHPRNRISALLQPEPATTGDGPFVRLDEEALAQMKVELEAWQIELYQEAYEKALEEQPEVQDGDVDSAWN